MIDKELSDAEVREIVREMIDQWDALPNEIRQAAQLEAARRAKAASDWLKKLYTQRAQ